jgi:hypothetical protein
MKTRLGTLLVLLTAASGLVACDKHETSVGETEGVYVSVDGLKYQVQISRQLNPANEEDREYLYGLDAADTKLAAGEEWFAVFLRVQNQEKDGPTIKSASKFLIEDTTGAEFEPVPLAVEANPHAYAPQRIGPEKHYPSADVTAGSSTTQGSMVLFRVTHSSLDNRPLEFHIASPTGKRDAVVDLDI